MTTGNKSYYSNWRYAQSFADTGSKTPGQWIFSVRTTKDLVPLAQVHVAERYREPAERPSNEERGIICTPLPPC